MYHLLLLITLSLKLGDLHPYNKKHKETQVKKKGKQKNSYIKYPFFDIGKSVTTHKRVLVPSNPALHKCTVCGCKFERLFDKKDETWYFRY